MGKRSIKIFESRAASSQSSEVVAEILRLLGYAPDQLSALLDMGPNSITVAFDGGAAPAVVGKLEALKSHCTHGQHLFQANYRLQLQEFQIDPAINLNQTAGQLVVWWPDEQRTIVVDLTIYHLLPLRAIVRKNLGVTDKDLLERGLSAVTCSRDELEAAYWDFGKKHAYEQAANKEIEEIGNFIRLVNRPFTNSGRGRLIIGGKNQGRRFDTHPSNIRFITAPDPWVKDA